MLFKVLRWLGVFVMGACTLIGAGMVVGGVSQIKQASRSVRWTPVPAKIISSSSTYASKGQRNFDVRYRYAVGDRTFESQTVRPGVGISTSSGPFATRMVRNYPLGREVTAYHDPDHPGVAVLEPGLDRNSFANLAAGWIGLLVGIGLAGVFFLPRGKLPRAALWGFWGLATVSIGLYFWVTP